MIVPVCDRPSLAEPTGPYGRLVMLWKARERQCARNCGHRDRQLPITGFAHKARIIGDTNETALGAALDMAAQRRGATRLDRAHNAPFGAAEVAGMRLAVRLAVAAEDVRHLERGHDWPSSVWRRFRQLQPVERAGRIADHGRCDLGIACRGRQMLMTE